MIPFAHGAAYERRRHATWLRPRARRRSGRYAGAAVGHHKHTAPGAISPFDSVTIVLPVHRLVGERLRVVRTERDRTGRRYVTAEHPGGWWIRLPLEWTDRA